MPDAAPQAWSLVQQFMRQSCGVVVRDDQQYLLEARLSPVARRFSFPTVDAYVAAACGSRPDPTFREALLDAMTTHETLFFRDPPFWEVLEKDVIPGLIAGGRTRPLRFWCAACSTGQEPYTLAMLLAESFPAIAATAEIHATDISAEAVQRARDAVYSTLELNRGINARRMIRHFETAPGGFRVKEAIRKRVTFGTFNLVGSAQPPVGVDVTLCRNVLIYFDEIDRSAVIQRLQRSTSSQGWVAVGSTEILPGRPHGRGWYRNDSGGKQ